MKHILKIMAFVYILQGDRYYVGSTTDLERRLREHELGKTHTTKRIGAWKLVSSKEFSTLSEARALERKIKQSGHIARWAKILSESS